MIIVNKCIKHICDAILAPQDLLNMLLFNGIIFIFIGLQQIVQCFHSVIPTVSVFSDINKSSTGDI